MHRMCRLDEVLGEQNERRKKSHNISYFDVFTDLFFPFTDHSIYSEGLAIKTTDHLRISLIAHIDY